MKNEIKWGFKAAGIVFLIVVGVVLGFWLLAWLVTLYGGIVVLFLIVGVLAASLLLVMWEHFYQYYEHKDWMTRSMQRDPGEDEDDIV